MKYPWIDEYLLSKRAVTKDLQPEWNWIRYHIGGKMFAAILLDDNNRPFYINLKLEPLEGELMRQNWPDIIPGYYSNKQHWNSVKADGAVPDDLLKTLLDRSYRLVLAGFRGRTGPCSVPLHNKIVNCMILCFFHVFRFFPCLKEVFFV